MKTLLVSDVISDFKMLPPQSIPDHSILSSKFVTSFYYVEKNFENTSTFQASNNDMQHKSLKPRKKNLSKINEGYMTNEETTELVQQAITRLEQKVESKKEIDLKWAEVKNILLTELKKLPDIPFSTQNKQNRKFKKSKSFWNNELETLWFNSCK